MVVSEAGKEQLAKKAESERNIQSVGRSQTGPYLGMWGNGKWVEDTNECAVCRVCHQHAFRPRLI